MHDLELGFRQKGSRLIRNTTCLDDDPGEIIRDEHEGMHQASKMQRLEGPDIGRSDHDDGFRVLDAILRALLVLDTLNDAMRPHDFSRVRMRPWTDENAMAADDNAAGGRIGLVHDR